MYVTSLSDMSNAQVMNVWKWHARKTIILLLYQLQGIKFGSHEWFFQLVYGYREKATIDDTLVLSFYGNQTADLITIIFWKFAYKISSMWNKQEPTIGIWNSGIS
jgi:hypothetical protein